LPFVPIEIRVMNQGGEPVDALAQPFIGPQLPDEGDGFWQQEEVISASSIATAPGEGFADGRKGSISGFPEDEIER
jgi:hypothetical protein